MISMTSATVVTAMLLLAGCVEIARIDKNRWLNWARILTSFGFFLLAGRYAWLAHTEDLGRLHFFGTIPIAVIAIGRIVAGVVLWRGKL